MYWLIGAAVVVVAALIAMDLQRRRRRRAVGSGQDAHRETERRSFDEYGPRERFDGTPPGGG